MSWGGLLKNAGIAALVAIIVNVLLTLAARPLLDIPAEFEPIHPVSSTIATTMYMAMGIVALLVIARFAKKKPALIYWILATVGLLLSFGPNVNLAMHPESIPGTTTPGMVFLAVQHVVAYLIFVPWVTRALGKSRA